MSRYFIFTLLIMLAIVCASASYYQHEYRSAAKSLADYQAVAHQQSATIDAMQRRQKSVAVLDAKYAQELADAKTTINRLHDDVATGRRRLQLNATCPKQSTSGTGGVGDDATATVTADAERDYWRLRDGITTATKQINYLQQYIKEQCLK